MVYIKVLDKEGALVSVEALEEPGWVRYDRVHEMLTRCTEERAEGVLSADAAVAYNFGAVGIGKPLTAFVIPPAEYDTLLVDAPDPEDTEPEPAEDPELEILSRAQLTALVRQQAVEIQDLNDQIGLLLSGVTDDET